MLQTWCGGTWLSIIDKLDYIQEMGMTAIWISPVSRNIDVETPYNYAYHGYWVNDPMELNPRFGSADDLHALSKALHDRGMYLMVDIVVNNVPSLQENTYLSPDALIADLSYLNSTEYFHPPCNIDYSNETSCEYCWLALTEVALMDVNTEHPDVIGMLQAWIKDLVTTYNIDGLRIDAAKHVPGAFWAPFCESAGVFCIGEVFGDDIPFAASFQTENWMDSVLGYPLYNGLVEGFGAPMGNMSGFVQHATNVLQQFPHPEYLGNFLENHDVPRWRNATVDPQLAYNAQIAQFMFDGVPIVYYGQEQDLHMGGYDPLNREALWPSNYTNGTTYQRLTKLNQLRTALINNGTLYQGKSYIDSHATILASTDYDVAFRKGPVLAVLTNRGSPSQDATFSVPQSGFTPQSSVIDVMSCRQFTVTSDGSVTVSYAASGYGGMPYIFMTQQDVSNLNWCKGQTGIGAGQVGSIASTTTTSAASHIAASTLSSALLAGLALIFTSLL